MTFLPRRLLLSVPGDAVVALAANACLRARADVTAAGASIEVRLVDHLFVPDQIRAHPGDRITFRNLRRALAPLLFVEHDRVAAEAQRASPVAAARVSPAARAKAQTRRIANGQPAHSFRTLLRDLATLTRNTVRVGDAPPLALLSRPTPLQQDVLHRLGLVL